ncbi:MAG: winged helix-turn-helix transcriptional regulator [Methanomicrobiaceae archaeon]|nr:winged helix-turn-helix transcriptional regulator [Methanomicrobiaceae archaeon]
MFKALGDPNRLQIISLLASDTTGKLGISDLAAKLGISQPAVSPHVRTLKNVHIVELRKEGYHVYLSFNRERISQYQEHSNSMVERVMQKCRRDSTMREKP